MRGAKGGRGRSQNREAGSSCVIADGVEEGRGAVAKIFTLLGCDDDVAVIMLQTHTSGQVRKQVVKFTSLRLLRLPWASSLLLDKVFSPSVIRDLTWS